MSKKWATFLVFLCLNLGAAYVPAMLWVPGLPGSASVGWKFLFSPVFLALLMMDATNPGIAWCVLVAFWLLVALASALLSHSRTAWWPVPGIVIIIYSALQGMLAARIIIGIDAIGH